MVKLIFVDFVVYFLLFLFCYCSSPIPSGYCFSSSISFLFHLLCYILSRKPSVYFVSSCFASLPFSYSFLMTVVLYLKLSFTDLERISVKK